MGRANSWAWALGAGLFLGSTLYAQETLLGDAAEPGTAGLSGGAVITVPEARVRSPQPELNLTDWTLLGAAAGLRYLDYQTTVKALSDPADFHEAELPRALVDNHAGFAAFEAGTVVANVWVYRLLVRRGHRRLARFGQAINLALVGGTVANNEYNLVRYFPSHH